MVIGETATAASAPCLLETRAEKPGRAFQLLHHGKYFLQFQCPSDHEIRTPRELSGETHSRRNKVGKPLVSNNVEIQMIKLLIIMLNIFEGQTFVSD